MAEFLYYYAIFATSVGIWACVDLLPEVRATLFEQNRLDDVMYDRPVIAAITLFVISTITAPLVVLTILAPSLRASAINALVKKV
jgi:hypothetical protein